MDWSRPPLDLSRLRVFPLATRKSLTKVDEIVIDPDSTPKPVSESLSQQIDNTAGAVAEAVRRKASVMLLFGAHLLRNGSVRILDRMMQRGWLTHLATNGATTIHDWEYSWLGRSTESVRDGVAQGNFGTWDETGRTLNLAVLVAGAADEGYGRGVGRFIHEDGVTVPTSWELEQSICGEPTHPLTAARADLLATITRHQIPAGRYTIEHPWKQTSLLAAAFRNNVPFSVHPGIGYDITATHPMFSGAGLGRGAHRDFAHFCAAAEGLDHGVVLSVGSAIMGPQVFEKSLSCVNNLRLLDGRPIVEGHSIHIVDLQDGGNWDWTQGEPPKTNPAYYLRFCKSFARMGGAMHYLQCDNLAFVHHLYARLKKMGI